MTEHFPLVTLRGGPTVRNLEINQDGVPMKAVVKFLIRGDAHDGTIYLYTKQIIRLDAEMEIEKHSRDMEEELDANT